MSHRIRSGSRSSRPPLRRTPLPDGVPVAARLPKFSPAATEDEVRGRLERLAGLGARSAELAHELRNALAVLETSLHLVKRTLRGSPDLAKVEPHLSRMAEQVHTGQALVREALDDVRAAMPERVPTELRGVAMEVVAGVARRDNIAVDVDIDPGMVDVDPRLVRQLLLNLVRNAVEAVESSADPGCVRVVGRRTERTMVLRVEDDGPGIDAEIAPRLFEAFATSKEGGTGLGLAVCRRIAEAHGGSIIAKAIEPRGTAMEVVIPR